MLNKNKKKRYMIYYYDRENMAPSVKENFEGHVDDIQNVLDAETELITVPVNKENVRIEIIV